MDIYETAVLTPKLREEMVACVPAYAASAGPLSSPDRLRSCLLEAGWWPIPRSTASLDLQQALFAVIDCPPALAPRAQNAFTRRVSS